MVAARLFIRKREPAGMEHVDSCDDVVDGIVSGSLGFYDVLSARAMGESHRIDDQRSRVDHGDI